MKETNFSAAKVATALLIASASTSTTADNGSSHQEKRSAEQYWQEFKRDNEQTWDSTKTAFREGWVEGKLHTAIALNENLKPFSIGIDVDGHTATLEGEVTSEIDRDLAKYIALGIEGIDQVNNQIQVNPEISAGQEKSESRDILQYMSDISTTAAIKTELLASSNINALSIKVDTYKNTVTLSGSVETHEERDLAETIAGNRHSVDKVVNNIEI